MYDIEKVDFECQFIDFEIDFPTSLRIPQIIKMDTTLVFVL